MNDRTPHARCARELLNLIGTHAEPRLSPSEQQYRRDEVNRVLGEMGDEAIAATLASLYRMAEADARRKARTLAQVIHLPRRRGLFSLMWSGLWERCRWSR